MRLIMLITLIIAAGTGSFGQCLETGDPVVTFFGNYSTGDYGPALANGQTTYIYNYNTLIKEGEYSIRKRTNKMNGWFDGQDHGHQGGYMMIINTKKTASAFLELQFDHLCSGNNNMFCFQAAPLFASINSGSAPVLSAAILSLPDNKLLKTFTFPALISNADSISWQELSFPFQIPAGVSAIKVILSHNAAPNGDNDFAVDDIGIHNFSGGGKLNAFETTINGSSDYPVYACIGQRVIIEGFPSSDMTKGKALQWQSALTTYSWQDVPNATTTSLIIDSVDRNDSRYYKLLIADSGNINNATCRIESKIVGLGVDPHPQASNNGPICEGTALQLAVDQGTVNAWSGPNKFSSTEKEPEIDHTILADSGLYTVSVSYGIDCYKDVIASTRVQIYQNLVSLNLGDDTVLCGAQKLLLNAGNIQGIYQWNTGAVSPEITVDTSGTYIVNVKEKGCTKADTINVSYSQKPSVFLGNDTTICAGDKIRLAPSALNNSTFLWQDGSSLPYYEVSKAGTYFVTIETFCGSASDTININTKNCGDNIILPNAFTPNNDGKNDAFRLLSLIQFQTFHLQIYNRWGKLIFETTDPAKGWDGFIKGQKAAAGAYVWEIIYQLKDGRLQHQQGTVLLIR